MVRLHRGGAPQELLQNQAELTAAWKHNCAMQRASDWAPDWVKAILRNALDPLSNGKCAFCESQLGISGYPEIEHYVSKRVDADRVLEWTNLMLACGRCNRPKGSKDHAGRLLKPDEDDPEEYFHLNLDSGKLQPRLELDPNQQTRAKESIDLCQLNRGALCQARLIAYNEVMDILEEAGEVPPHVTERRLTKMLAAREAYKLSIRCAFVVAGYKELAEKDRENFRNGR